MLKLNDKEIKPALFTKISKSPINWFLTDIAFIESISHFKNKPSIANKIFLFYKEHKIESFCDFFNIADFLQRKRKLREVDLKRIRTIKKDQEIKMIFTFFEKITTIYWITKIKQQNLQPYTNRIYNNIKTLIIKNERNKVLIKAWISNHLDLFYKDEHYPLREKLRKLLFSIIFCLEWNIIAAINDVDIGTLRDLMEFENYTPQTPSKKDLENVVKILNKDINDNDSTKKNIFFKDDLIQILAQSRYFNSSDEHRFHKELVKRIFWEEKKINKNDFWDAMFMRKDKADIVLTYDSCMLGIFNTIDEKYYDSSTYIANYIEKGVTLEDFMV